MPRRCLPRPRAQGSSRRTLGPAVQDRLELPAPLRFRIFKQPRRFSSEVGANISKSRPCVKKDPYRSIQGLSPTESIFPVSWSDLDQGELFPSRENRTVRRVGHSPDFSHAGRHTGRLADSLHGSRGGLFLSFPLPGVKYLCWRPMKSLSGCLLSGGMWVARRRGRALRGGQS